MKNDIELFEYFRKKGWILNPRKMQLIVASYGLGYRDADHEISASEDKS